MLYAARWHYAGKPILYCSTTPELALLEKMAHLPNVPIEQQEPLVLLTIDIPFEDKLFLKKYGASDLPVGWNNLTDQTISREFLRPWTERPDTLAVAVPSVIVPMSYNVLLHAYHPMGQQVRCLKIEPFPVDGRFLAKKQA